MSLNTYLWKKGLEYIYEYSKFIIDNIQLRNKSAVVFDIDDTLFLRNGEIISEMALLLNYAYNKGFSIFIVTNRDNSDMSQNITFEQLVQSNLLQKIQAIYFRPHGTHDYYKSKIDGRKDIRENGYIIHMCVGDMACDVGQPLEDYAGIPIILPKLKY